MALYAIMLDSEIKAHKHHHPVAKESPNSADLLGLTQVEERLKTKYAKKNYSAKPCQESEPKKYFILEEEQYETGNVYELKIK